MPFKDDVSCLGDSKIMAIRRFTQLENKLLKDTELYSNYCSFMKEYEQLGHMQYKSNVDIESNNNDIQYYIPHHAVIKDSSSTTKLRVVFNASAKSTSGVSLNDIMMTGPQVQNDLFSILIRFRTYKYVFSADIEKMYRQVLIDSSQHNLQNIIWRNNINEPLKVYELKTVTYGTRSAPFLATRTLNQLAVDESHNFPQAYKCILENFYVDDVLCGADTIESTLVLQKELEDLLQLGGFHLRKWSSNHPDILTNVPTEDIEAHPDHKFDDDITIVKTLGLIWNTELDVFKYLIRYDDQSTKKEFTKRDVLSTIAKIFDPLGLIGPVILIAKLIMQTLWQRGVSWDEILPPDIIHSWTQFYDSLRYLNGFNINRYILTLKKKMYVELHGFADASIVAYGACVYIWCQDDTGQVTIALLASKSRVAPLKTISLPRLELCAALLLCHLMNNLNNALNITKDNVFYYTDSTIVLSWLQSPSTHYSTFVSNRVAKIQLNTNIQHWNHVSSSENPADIISRGCSVESIIQSELWWNGPFWLAKEPYFWRNNEIHQHIIEFNLLPELKKG